MNEESSIKNSAWSDKVSQLDLADYFSLFSSKRLLTHFSTHTKAHTVAHTVTHT